MNFSRKAPGLRESTIRLLRYVGLNRWAAQFYYRWLHGFSPAGKELPAVIERCFAYLSSQDSTLEGDYYEFGVFKGATFFTAYQSAQSHGLDSMRFFGFDSFTGIPSVEGIDNVEDAPFYEGQFAWPIERVKCDLDKRGINWNRCELIRGYFIDTLTEETRQQFNMQSAAIALVDCDLYNSAASALDFLGKLVVDGSVIIMDDWNAFDANDARGERRAFAEFLELNPQWTAEPWFSYGLYGQVFIIRSADSYPRARTRYAESRSEL